MRYHVCRFPSYLGTPIEFKSRRLALLFARWLSFKAFIMWDLREIRVIDQDTHDHLLVL